MDGCMLEGRKLIIDYDTGGPKKGFRLNFKEEGNLKYN